MLEILSHNGMKFSTKDKDNDVSLDNCAVLFSGAWWYESCYLSNLNGLYLKEYNVKGINWFHFRDFRSLKFTEMKLQKN